MVRGGFPKPPTKRCLNKGSGRVSTVGGRHHMGRIQVATKPNLDTGDQIVTRKQRHRIWLCLVWRVPPILLVLKGNQEEKHNLRGRTRFISPSLLGHL